MSVVASKKEKAKVEFITNGQNLLIDIGNWIDGQKANGKTTGLDDFYKLASQAYICMSFANHVRIADIDSYASRLDNFRKAKSYYRTLREYLTVISAMYQIKKKQKRKVEQRIHKLYEMAKQFPSQYEDESQRWEGLGVAA